jgi:hypothetical protein
MYQYSIPKLQDYQSAGAHHLTQITGHDVYKSHGSCTTIWEKSSDHLVKPEGFNIPYDANAFTYLQIGRSRWNFVGGSLEKFNIALGKANLLWSGLVLISI